MAYYNDITEIKNLNFISIEPWFQNLIHSNTSGTNTNLIASETLTNITLEILTLNKKNKLPELSSIEVLRDKIAEDFKKRWGG